MGPPVLAGRLPNLQNPATIPIRVTAPIVILSITVTLSQKRAAHSRPHGHAAATAIPARPAPRLAPPTADASTNQRGRRRAPKGAGSVRSLHAEKARGEKRAAPLAAPGSAFRPASPALPLAESAQPARSRCPFRARRHLDWRDGAGRAERAGGPAPALRHHERRRRAAAAARDAAGSRRPRGGPHGRASFSRQVSADRTRPEGGGPAERRRRGAGRDAGMGILGRAESGVAAGR